MWPTRTLLLLSDLVDLGLQVNEFPRPCSQCVSIQGLIPVPLVPLPWAHEDALSSSSSALPQRFAANQRRFLSSPVTSYTHCYQRIRINSCFHCAVGICTNRSFKIPQDTRELVEEKELKHKRDTSFEKAKLFKFLKLKFFFPQNFACESRAVSSGKVLEKRALGFSLFSS